MTVMISKRDVRVRHLFLTELLKGMAFGEVFVLEFVYVLFISCYQLIYIMYSHSALLFAFYYLIFTYFYVFSLFFFLFKNMFLFAAQTASSSLPSTSLPPRPSHPGHRTRSRIAGLAPELDGILDWKKQNHLKESLTHVLLAIYES